MQNNITSPNIENDLESLEENNLRPKILEDFIGQNDIKKNLRVFIESALKRKKSLDHTLFYGPPGLGKTTLANILAKEMNSAIKSTSGPILSKTADLVAILTSIQANDVIFIDEIHRLPIAVEEILYSALEDFKIDIMIGDGPSARSIKIDLPPFTLVGATTRIGMLSNPLRGRFGILLPLQFYDPEQLSIIVSNFCKKHNILINKEGALEIGKISRRTPRIALRIVRRVIDFCIVKNQTEIDRQIVQEAAESLSIDNIGLDKDDISYLMFIATNYNGGPVGIETIIAGLSGDKQSVEETIEPFLIQEGFISKTLRGRVLTKKGMTHLGINGVDPMLKIMKNPNKDTSDNLFNK